MLFQTLARIVLRGKILDSKTKKGLVVLLIVAAVSLCGGFFRNCVFSERSDSPRQMKIKTGNKTYTAVVPIRGTIQDKSSEYNQEWLLKVIETLKEDRKNVAILLVIDSPGGTVYHADEAYLALVDYKSSGKKVFAYFESLAASGGYYIACAADRIFANRNTLTGSIGVISATSFDATEFLDKIGISSKTIHSGKNKNMFSFNEKVTEEQEKIMQSLADECYGQFTQIVAENRNLPIEDVLKIADGRLYSARQAKENGLIDEIATLKETEDSIKNECLKDDMIFKTLKYKAPDNLRSILMEGIGFLKNPEKALGGKYPLAYLYAPDL